MIIATDASHRDEARRVLEICNSCRYCEGLCATFQALARRRSFADQDFDYLANLCHNCTACYHDCQYAPPHAFAVNVPAALTDMRVETYARYAWPGAMGRWFYNNGLVVSLVTTLLITATLLLALLLIEPDVLYGRFIGPGAFYEVIGHGVMVGVAGVTFGFSVLSLSVSVVKFWRGVGGSGLPSIRSIIQACTSAATLKHLDGGHGEGCSSVDDGFSNQRRMYHQFTMWGFVLCFAATCVATIYDYGFGLVAPYDYFSLPVVLGTVGGIGLLVGPVGLIWNKIRSDSRPMRAVYYGMDYAFLLSLLLVSLSGLLLLVLRETAAMGMALVIHLGLVFGFFVLLPYSKFVHGIYRFVALLHYAEEGSAEP